MTSPDIVTIALSRKAAELMLSVINQQTLGVAADDFLELATSANEIKTSLASALTSVPQ